jgi:hypothetical protein
MINISYMEIIMMSDFIQLMESSKGVVVHDVKVGVFMAVFSKMCNKIHSTKQNYNLFIEMNVSM